MKKSFLIAGDVKDVCLKIEQEADKYAGYTVAQYIMLKELEEVTRRQLEEVFNV
jgi:hypothetical protein